MPYIVGKARNEHELYTRVKAFVCGAGTVGTVTFSGVGTGTVVGVTYKTTAALADTLTLTCQAAGPNHSGSFGVSSALRGVLADAELNKVYDDPEFQFYLAFGDVDFAVGDTFTLRAVAYSAASKPKLSYVTPKTAALSETITLTCTAAGKAQIGGVQPFTPAIFSVVGSVSGALGTCTQGQSFDSTVISFSVGEGDITSVALQFNIGDSITIYTTQNPLKALGQAWIVQRESYWPAGTQFGAQVPESDKELILKGVGLAGTDEICVGIRRAWNNTEGSAKWELSGMRGYAPGLTYDEQPKALPASRRPSFLVWSGEIPFWLSVTGREIRLKVRCNTYYMDVYLGLGTPWGSPKYQPYFLCVGGSSGAGETLWSSLGTANSNFWAPRNNDSDKSSLQILTKSGVWQGFLVRKNNSREPPYSGGGWVNSASPSVGPYRGNGMQRVLVNLDGSSPLYPVTCLPDEGELSGIVALSGYGQIEPENIVLQAGTGRRFVVGTNVYRNAEEDFSGMELK